MIKKIIITGLVLIGVGAVCTYYYISTKYAQAKAIDRDEITVFFKHAQQQLATLPTQIQKLKQKHTIDKIMLQKLEEQLHAITIMDIIARGDSEALKKISFAELQCKDGDVVVDGKEFKHNMNGTITSRMLGAENALAFVLFHAILDQTQQDKDKTLAMLHILFDKKLDPHGKAVMVYWIQDNPRDNRSRDYVAMYSLSEIASHYSFPEAQKILKAYTANFEQNTGIETAK